MSTGFIVSTVCVGLLFLTEVAAFCVTLTRLRKGGMKGIRHLLRWGFAIQIPGGHLNCWWLAAFFASHCSLAETFRTLRGFQLGAPPPNWVITILYGLNILNWAGALLFTAAVLVLGMSASRTAQRVAELEAVAATMRAELAARGESI